LIAHDFLKNENIRILSITPDDPKLIKDEEENLIKVQDSGMEEYDKWF